MSLIKGRKFQRQLILVIYTAQFLQKVLNRTLLRYKYGLFSHLLLEAIISAYLAFISWDSLRFITRYHYGGLFFKLLALLFRLLYDELASLHIQVYLNF